jgi:hypothetical protein
MIAVAFEAEKSKLRSTLASKTAKAKRPCIASTCLEITASSRRVSGMG